MNLITCHQTYQVCNRCVLFLLQLPLHSLDLLFFCLHLVSESEQFVLFQPLLAISSDQFCNLVAWRLSESAACDLSVEIFFSFEHSWQIAFDASWLWAKFVKKFIANGTFIKPKQGMSHTAHWTMSSEASDGTSWTESLASVLGLSQAWTEEICSVGSWVCLFSRCATRSSSVDNVDNISCGSGDEAKLSFASLPNIAFYGVLFIPEWWLLFFLNCTNVKPTFQEVPLLSLIQIMSMSLMSALPLYTLPWDCG